MTVVAVIALALMLGAIAWAVWATHQRNKADRRSLESTRRIIVLNAMLETSRQSRRYFSARAKSRRAQVNELRAGLREAILEVEKSNPGRAGELIRARWRRLLTNQDGESSGAADVHSLRDDGATERTTD